MTNIIESIKSKVYNKANKKSKEIVALAIISFLLKESSNFDTSFHLSKQNKTGATIGCGCAYCVALYKYVALKKLKHRLVKISTDDDFVFKYNSDGILILDKVLVDYYKNRIQELDYDIKSLKIKKDNLKIKLNL